MDARSLTVLFALVCVAYAWPKQFSGFKRENAGGIPQDALDACVKMGYTEKDCRSGIQECIDNSISMEKCGEYHVKKAAVESCVKMGYTEEICRHGIQECVTLNITMENCGAHHAEKLKQLCIKYGMDTEEKCGAFAKNMMGIAQFCLEESMTEDQCKKFGEVWYDGFVGCEAMGYSQKDCINGFKICINQWGIDNPADCGEKWKKESQNGGFNKGHVYEILRAGQMCLQYGVCMDDCVEGVWECIENKIEGAEACKTYHMSKGDDKRSISKFAGMNALRRGFSIKKK